LVGFREQVFINGRSLLLPLKIKEGFIYSKNCNGVFDSILQTSGAGTAVGEHNFFGKIHGS
jgi:hypothetical protein